MPSRSTTCPERETGFVLPTAIFLLVVMAALAAFMVQISASGQQESALDVQGGRAYQAARLGIDAGLYSVRVSNSCPASTTLTSPQGMTGFKITWTCTPYAFTESAANKTIWQITSTACTTTGAACPSATPAEILGGDYVERQLEVVTEQ